MALFIMVLALFVQIVILSFLRHKDNTVPIAVPILLNVVLTFLFGLSLHEHLTPTRVSSQPVPMQRKLPELPEPPAEPQKKIKLSGPSYYVDRGPIRQIYIF